MKLKVGIFGTGHIGKIHVNNWKEIKEIELIGFYDTDDAVAKEVEEKYKLKRFATLESLLEKIDIADITAPTTCHYALCEKAVKKGKHVFVEKPLATTLDEVKRIIAMVKEANVKVQVGHEERFNPAFVAAKKVISNPMYIEAHRLSPFNSRNTEINIVQDLMIHDLDIILSLVKNGVRHIIASGICVVANEPDIVSARIEFDNGCIANLTASRINREKLRTMRLFQKSAYVDIDFLKKKTEITQINQSHSDKPVSSDAAAQLTFSVSHPPIQDLDAIKEELKSFVETIIHNKQPAVSEIDAYLAMEIAQQIMDKISSNNTVIPH